MLSKLLSVLRRPRVIVAEMAAIGILASLGAIFPGVFQSVWFAAVTALAAASLSLSVTDQVRRIRIAWSKRLTEEDFNKAPFRAEFNRPVQIPESAAGARQEVATIRSKGRLGLTGPAVFHAGLLLVVLAGTGHALFGVHATADLIEGETLKPAAEAWNVQHPGILAAPFQFQVPVTLDKVMSRYYKKGDLHDLKVQLSLDSGGRVRSEEVAVNRDLHVQGRRLYLGSDFGPAPLIEWLSNGRPPLREAPMLTEKGKSVYEGSSSPSDGIQAYLRVRLPPTGERSDRIEVRVMKDRGLLFTDTVQAGATVKVTDGLELRLHGIPFWARLYGSRDPALWLAYLGFGLVVVGAAIMFTVIKVDTCVIVRAAGGHERVLVAMNVQRLGPLFEEGFRKLVREQGGPS